jgi:predicted methyltransferase
MRNFTMTFSLLGSLWALGALAADQGPAVPAHIAAAIADASRPDGDRDRDIHRKPAEVLTFAGVKPGDKVGELMPGRGYFTKIFCKAVGDTGHVYTVAIARATPPNPPPAGASPPPPPPPPPPPTGQACTNVTAATVKMEEFSLPPGLDMVWTSENYHDFNNPMFGSADLVAFNKIVFAALKPGGVYMIEDHAAAAGTGKSVTDTLHRIDPAAVIADVTAAGFVLEAQSTLLARSDDPHAEPPFKLPGKTDKFLMKFRKPR